MRAVRALLALAVLLLATIAAEPASGELTSAATLSGTAALKTGRTRVEAEAIFALAFGDGAFRLDLAPCYTVTGTTKPKGRKGDRLRLTVDDASRPAWRELLVLFAARSGTGPSTASKDATKMVLTLEEGGTATLSLKARLTARKAKATSVKATLAGAVEKVAAPPVPVACRFVDPTASQPLALTARGEFLAVANPDSDSVSFFDVRGGANVRIAEVPVQDEPNGVAFLPDGSKAYVTNTASGTVSVVPVAPASGAPSAPSAQIPVGVEPYGLAMAPNGTRLYVSNARSSTVSVIDTATDAVIQTIAVGPEPRGLAVTNDGDPDDLDETVFVTQFLSPLDAAQVPGADDAKSGRIFAIDTGLGFVTATHVLPPLADTGFPAAGDALGRIPPGPDLVHPTGAFPNQLNNVAVKGGFLYVPNVGASPNGPLRFDANVQSLVSFISPDTAAAGSINLQRAVAEQPSPAKRFLAVPWAIAFENASDAGWVVSAASDVVAKLAVDPGTGVPAVQRDPKDPDRVLEIAVGKNPRGIVIDAADARAYVMNRVSRDVSVLDLAASPEKVVATLPSAALPGPGTPEHRVHVGRELYHTSIGRFDPPDPRKPPIVGRMSKDGWSSCAACHPDGLSDGVVWMFPDGPRRTIPQHADFDPADPLRLGQRILNASATRDEEEDFELDLRAVAGGEGLIVLEDGVTPDPDVASLVPLASGGRRQLSVEGVPAWDALVAYVRFGIRAPIAPVAETNFDVVAGRVLFSAANCQLCHGGPHWTRSTRSHTPPPDAALVTDGQLTASLVAVGTFDPGAFDEVDADAGAPLGASGFAIPSLLSASAFEETLLHSGAALTFDDVLQNVTHRSAGTGGVDTLSNAADRAKIAVFLRSIDVGTTPLP
jgi:YVTN family beta-propeller protein